MKRIVYVFYLLILTCPPVCSQVIDTPSVTNAKNLIIGTWYIDHSKYSEPQEIVPIDTSFKTVYDQNNIYYYEDDVLVDQCWYEIRNTDCDGNGYIDKVFLVTPDPTTGEDICEIIGSISDEQMFLIPEGRGDIFRYVKQ